VNAGRRREIRDFLMARLQIRSKKQNPALQQLANERLDFFAISNLNPTFTLIDLDIEITIAS
jgi:hypothetical protein